MFVRLMLGLVRGAVVYEFDFLSYFNLKSDVSICLKYLIEIYGCKEEVKKIRLEKFERELQRIQRNAE